MSTLLHSLAKAADEESIKTVRDTIEKLSKDSDVEDIDPRFSPSDECWACYPSSQCYGCWHNNGGV